MKLNRKEIQILSVTLAICGVTLIGSGITMNSKVKPIIHTNYSVSIKQKKIAETQAKTNEIKLKEIQLEINTPLSVDIKDYLEDVENIDDETLKALKLDTSLVNINQAGTYQYTVTYKKKKYIGTVSIKEKELPKINLTLKEITINTGDSLPSVSNSNELKYYINETIPEEILSKVKIEVDISKVKSQLQGDYPYYITYNDTVYQGTIHVRDKIGMKTEKDEKDEKDKKECPTEATTIETEPKLKCKCPEGKTYNNINNTCINNPGT